MTVTWAVVSLLGLLKPGLDLSEGSCPITRRREDGFWEIAVGRRDRLSGEGIRFQVGGTGSVSVSKVESSQRKEPT